MLAKPEYFSPPDEVCCWPGGAAAESHREDVAGQGRCGGEPSGRCCWPGTLRGDGAKWKSERKSLPLRRRRCDATDAQQPLRCNRCAEAAAMQQRHRSSSAGRQKETASKHRSLAQKKQPGTEACDPNAGCARKITIRVNILLTLQPANREATNCGAARHPRSNNLRSDPSPRGAERYLKKSSSRYLGSGQSSSSIIISNLSALRRIFSIYGKTVLL